MTLRECRVTFRDLRDIQHSLAALWAVSALVIAALALPVSATAVEKWVGASAAVLTREQPWPLRRTAFFIG